MKKALTLILILFQCTRIFGQWNPGSPTVVCNASEWQENATIIGDGAGGHIVPGWIKEEVLMTLNLPIYMFKE